jgi:hypothetical protein
MITTFFRFGLERKIDSNKIRERRIKVANTITYKKIHRWKFPLEKGGRL